MNPNNIFLMMFLISNSNNTYPNDFIMNINSKVCNCHSRISSWIAKSNVVKDRASDQVRAVNLIPSIRLLLLIMMQEEMSRDTLSVLTEESNPPRGWLVHGPTPPSSFPVHWTGRWRPAVQAEGQDRSSLSEPDWRTWFVFLNVKFFFRSNNLFNILIHFQREFIFISHWNWWKYGRIQFMKVLSMWVYLWDSVTFAQFSTPILYLSILKQTTNYSSKTLMFYALLPRGMQFFTDIFETRVLHFEPINIVIETNN